MNAEKVIAGECWKCGNTLEVSDYGRQDHCEKCYSDTHVCMNCIFHDRAYNNECRENQSDRVVEKEKSNFCDYFKPKHHQKKSEDPLLKARSAAESLFKKK